MEVITGGHQNHFFAIYCATLFKVGVIHKLLRSNQELWKEVIFFTILEI